MMERIRGRILAVVLLALVALAGPSMGHPKAAPHKSQDKSQSVWVCPACQMPMPPQPSQAYPVSIAKGGKIYYCCRQCRLGKAALGGEKNPAR